ncbi:hypothetical protein [Psychrobacter sp. FDAARGOS_221]|uniref:hypothetical protein n=1 Tax=Psychrobacter sp. FDAARGOS_221 TaxID=1975705 RepID=UPI000BB55BA0|nr:hypothetical protein [Psychrobacter sp. FDAARGOS_221]PNK61099.1 hypothetical protein A6J60_009585 [Psychrobacter sp. FDAARGOS_221]
MDDAKTRQNLYRIAVQCFRNPADQDYIHARLAYQNNLIQQFLWSSLHCLEKYTKCILVANGISAKDFGHVINPAIDLFEEKESLSLNLSVDVRKFNEDLELARYRYITVSNISKGSDILLLDKAVHEIRWYCQQFSSNKEDRKPQILELADKNGEAEIKNIERISLNGGVLESILNDKKHPARKALIYQNAFFSTRKRSTVSINKSITAYNSVFFENPDLFQLAEGYIRIEKEVKRAYKDKFGLPN